MQGGRTVRIVLRTLSEFHVGAGAARGASHIDSAFYRLRDANGREKLVVPGSTIKGAFRAHFEEKIREKVLGRPNIAQYAYNILRNAVKDVGTYLGLGNQLLNHFDYMARRETSLRQIGEKPWENAPYAYLPLVCDPLSQFHCNHPLSVLDFGEDRSETIRFIASVVLLRRVPTIKDQHDQHEKKGGDGAMWHPPYCPACLLFGGAGNPSPLIFSHLETDKAATGLQTRVSIDRLRGAAAPAKLFTAEYVGPGATFEGHVELAEHTAALEALGLDRCWASVLRELANNIKQLGRFKSVGYGLVKVEVEVPHDCSTQGAVEQAYKQYIDLVKRTYGSGNVKNALREMMKHAFERRGENKDVDSIVDKLVENAKATLDLIQ